eukprot:5841964-Pyramimonas_sp.AAC.2
MARSSVVGSRIAFLSALRRRDESLLFYLAQADEQVKDVRVVVHHCAGGDVRVELRLRLRVQRLRRPAQLTSVLGLHADSKPLLSHSTTENSILPPNICGCRKRASTEGCP